MPRITDFVALTAVAALSACAGDNQPPSLALTLDQQVTVGESLRLVLVASDPDGDTLDFTASGLPDGAQLTPRSATEAVLSYSPVITDTQPGGRRYDVEVQVADGSGGVARQSFGLLVFPTFGVPTFDLPSGVVVNLARDEDLSLLVEVKDDDSTDVAIALTEAPTGARLQKASAKGAFFYWRPDAAQRAVAVHRAVFTANDESHGAITHVLTIVLLNGEKQSGCVGAPPTIAHAPPADQALAGALTLSATLTDAESLVASATVHWTTGDPNGAYTAAALTREGETFVWSADVAVPAAPAGGDLVHYYVTAIDNDDPTGVACDQQARLPKTGWLTAAYYPPGTPSTACIDDASEDDDTAGTAPTLPAGTWPGRRLCGADVDVVRVAIPAGSTLTAQAAWAPAHGSASLALVGAAGQTLGEASDPDGDGVALLRHDAPAGEDVALEIRATTPGARLSYTLSLSVDDVVCEDDPLEPNDAPANAVTVGEGTTEGLRVCPGDEDWFRVSLPAGQTMRFQVAFDHRYGDLDVELRSGDGQTVLATAASEKSIEELTWRSDSARDVVLRVYGVQGARNDYRLIVDRAPNVGQCPADALGGNHAPLAAVVLFQGVYEGFTVCDVAPDWFAVDLNGGETLTVLVESEAGAAVTVDVYEDPAQSPVATSTFGGGLSGVDYTVSGAGPLWYAIRASVPEVGYTMLQEVTDPPGGCAPDRFDPNDTRATATAAGEGVYTWLRMCPGTDVVDAFAFEVAPFTTIVAFTGHFPDDGYTDLRLVDPSGAEVASGLDERDGAYLEHLAETGGTWVLFVDAFEPAATLPYDLAIFFD